MVARDAIAIALVLISACERTPAELRVAVSQIDDNHQNLVVLDDLDVFGAPTTAQPNCSEPPLTVEKIVAFVAAARDKDPKMPQPYEDYTAHVRQKGCYYTYAEFMRPSRHRHSLHFTLNRGGTVVDVSESSDGFAPKMTCHGRPFNKTELADIVRTARANRTDLPAPFDEFKPLLARPRCLHYYTEWALMKAATSRTPRSNSFLIDRFGGIVGVQGRRRKKDPGSPQSGQLRSFAANPITSNDTSSRSFTDADQAVLELVTSDLLNYEEFRTFGTWAHKKQLVIADRTIEPSFFPSETGFLTASRRDPEEVVSALYYVMAERNRLSVSLAAFRPSSPGILVAPDDFPRYYLDFPDAFEERFPDAKALVRMWLPAFSKDERAALVRFDFAPTPHGASGTYYLEKVDGRWAVVWRELAYYL